MKCCICGTVRNCEKYLDQIFKNMEKIGSLFDEYVIILYYDPSDDNTLQKIQDYKLINDRVVVYKNKEDLSPYRTHRIAKGRNICLKYMKARHADTNMFIMMDCDDVCSADIKLEVLQKYLHRDDWDSLSFNKPNYYDLWALSIRPYIFSFVHFNPEPRAEMTNYITQKLKDVPKDGLLECHSAFNGFAIYKMNKFANCKYSGNIRLDLIPPEYIEENIKINNSPIVYHPKRWLDIQNEDCEHRSFHMDAIKKNDAKIRISPEILF